jgi:hypothetical protein
MTVKAIEACKILKNMKMTAFWDILPCSLVEVDLRFRGAYCFETTQRYIPKSCHFHTHHHENLKSRILNNMFAMYVYFAKAVTPDKYNIKGKQFSLFLALYSEA